MDLEANLEEKINAETFGSQAAESIYCQYKLKDIEKDLISRYFTKAKAKILDVGCGYGRTTKILDDMGFLVVGIDVVSAMINRAIFNDPEIDYRLMSATKIGFPDDYFDYVLFSFNGLDFIYPQERRLEALKEIYRVLKPGGVFIMSTHNRAAYFLRIFVEFNKNCLATVVKNALNLRLFSPYWWTWHTEGDLILFNQTVNRQIEEFSDVGFVLEEIKGRNFLNGWKMKLLEPWPHYVLRKKESSDIIQTDQRYSFGDYLSFGRWASYFYQIEETINLGSQNVLEIGVGDKVVGNYLENELKIKYTSVDINQNLSPSIVASIDNLPISDNSFDLVLACEVLEHLPYNHLSSSLEELSRVSSKHVIISLPHFGPPIKISFKLPFFPEVKLALKLSWPKRHYFNGQHYWEIGKKSFGPGRIRQDLEKHFIIQKEFIPFENQYHHFYVLRKK